jgi:transcriptional regulator with XRE-family HTH domain
MELKMQALITSLRESGLTQAQIAERLGISQAAISQWYAGTTQPSCETLSKMHQRLRKEYPVIALAALEALTQAGLEAPSVAPSRSEVVL